MITGDNGILHTKLCADPDGEWPLSNLWFGISAEDQETANKRIPLLFQILSAVRWVSAEPLLSNIDFVGPGYFADPVHMEAGGLVGIDWVVLGGESGPNARHMELGWARSIRDQCLDAGVPFFFKQWGEYVPGVLTHEDAEEPWREYQNGNRCWGFSEVGQKDLPEIIYSRVGKKKAGRQLDGEIHSEYPV
jgi:protein gp37